MAEADRKMDESHSGAVDSWVGAAQEVATEAAQKAADSSAYVQEQLSAWMTASAITPASR
jgi:hypothetical protein